MRFSLPRDSRGHARDWGSRPSRRSTPFAGKTVVNLFFEASTRTRTSFEIAEEAVERGHPNIAAATSSVVKGETLVDTALNLEAMSPDMIVVRTRIPGRVTCCRASASRHHQRGHGMHEHPTQALLDAFTIREHKERIAGLKVAIVGDLLNSRVLRSNVQLLTKLGRR